MTRPVPLDVSAAVREVAEPVLRAVGLREVDRRLGRAPGYVGSSIRGGYSPSVDWWADALRACGRGLRVETDPGGAVRVEVTG